MELIDTHVHLDSEEYSKDLDEVIERAREAGITRIVTIGAGYGLKSAENASQIASQYDFIYASAGVHPHDAATEFKPDYIKELAMNPKVVAIGETGLDFFRDWSPRDLQEKWFRAQILIAKEVKKPLIIHSRDAGSDCMRILIEEHAEEVGGVFHCYSEDADFAKKLLDINFMVSIPGSITFKKADKFREIVREIPLSQIMLETDGPYMAPEPNRGKRCESAFMVETARKVAEIKNISLEELAAVTTENARRFYSIK